MAKLPRLLFTLGDVAGIGPEVLIRAWPALLEICQPVAVGDLGCLRRASDLLGYTTKIREIAELANLTPTTDLMCLRGSRENLEGVALGRVNARAGRAAFDFLCTAIDLVQAGQADGLVTLPLHKEGLKAAGLRYPGHTEILAERTGTRNFAMMLYARGPRIPQGLGVVHVTLHMALRDVFQHLSTAAVVEKIGLLHEVLGRLGRRPPRLGVAALNPHASDGGLFGYEEANILAPAVAQALAKGFHVTGPWPSDTLFLRAQDGVFDGIVAMYHDQGHIPMKLLSGLHAVNVTLGLPIVRTSVAHGTAYDIAGLSLADPGSLIEATRVAASLAQIQAGERAT